jgi:hypothetical protein
MMEFKTTSALQVRDLDDIYVRALIDGKWENRCLTDLVWEDVENWLVQKLSKASPYDIQQYLLYVIKRLHFRMREIGDYADIKRDVKNREDGIPPPDPSFLTK